MQYLQKEPFTVPASDGKVSELRWDYAFLSADEFYKKHGIRKQEVETDLNGNRCN